jgi:MbtH protein
MSVATILRNIVAEQLGVDADAVTADALFTDDLDADSLDLEEIVMAVEDEFGIEIPDEDAQWLYTIRKLAAYIEASSADTSAPPADASRPPSEEDAPSSSEEDAAAAAAAGDQAAGGETEDDGEDTTLYAVVVNGDEQYAIWPLDRETPAGWRPAGKQGTKSECLKYIQEVGGDMRPQSVRPVLGDAGP